MSKPLIVSQEVREPLVAQALLSWYRADNRVLPWRSQPEPYRVWVSEIMLQQTRVATVIPYFERWMERFPTLESLASAELDDVLAMWAGLGYYRRARLLHRAARYVVDELDGVLPSDVKGLLTVPGIGRYTAGAISSIAFGQPAPIVDGNVIRVLCRIFGLEGNPRASPLEKTLWAMAERLIPEGHAGDFNQSMMELGAMVCTPKSASCGTCPVHEYCVARREGRVDELPQLVKKKPPKPVLVGAAVICQTEPERFLLIQRPTEGLFGGLWELPTAQLSIHPDDPRATELACEAVRERLAALGVVGSVTGTGGRVVHQLTHLQMTFLPVHVKLVRLAPTKTDTPMLWVPLGEILDQALASAMRKVVSQTLIQPSLF